MHDPQIIQFVKTISLAQLQKLTKSEYIKLYQKVKEVRQLSENYHFHLSVFIGTIEL